MTHPTEHTSPSRGTEPAPRIVAQLMFVEENESVLQLDAVALAIQDPVERPLAAGLMSIQCIPISDPMCGPLMVDLLRQWADDCELVEIQLTWKPRPMAMIEARGSRMRLDLAA